MMRSTSCYGDIALPDAGCGRGASQPVWRARGDRLRWVAVLVMIHASLGLVGRLTGLIGDAAVPLQGAMVMLIVGLGGDVLEAGRLGLPIALMWVLLPARVYQSFAFWMLTGFVSLSAIAVSVALALERARGAVTGTIDDLPLTMIVSDNFWLQHPVAAALIVASLCAALLLGPVRRAATDRPLARLSRRRSP